MEEAVPKIISGGQTGIDRMALELARELGLGTGGTAPKGYTTESGPDAISTLDRADATADDSFAPGDGGSDSASPISWDGRAPVTHRDASAACPRERLDGGGLPCSDAGIPLPGNPCVRDSDCTSGQDGICLCAPDLVPPDTGTGPGILYTETFCSYDECFVDSDCSLAEVNPLVVLKDGKLLALDAKIGFDDRKIVYYLLDDVELDESEKRGTFHDAGAE